jgi:branched-subunit amino acid ABC-type transport system permease component
MRPAGALGTLIGLLFYAVTGLAFHLIAYGEVDWSGAFVYVAMAFWPLLLAWEVLKIAAIVALVVVVGLAAYALVRGLFERLNGRGI